ncbi:MAG TPA: type II secretion system protein GspM [Xanthobacteraceae bacterium]|nr:type II secretion system protein GspM [Xanthobacteraceae bacterium]
MKTDRAVDRILARYPGAATLAYGLVLVVLLLIAWSALADVYARYLDYAAASELLDQIEGRRPAPAGAAARATAAPTGSPFLEGPTVTVAGAALQQRVTGAVAKVGGNVLSSQVELDGSKAKQGYVSLVASCEVEQPALQQLLYDLEAGMPFLFVDQLVVQAPQTGTGEEGGRMRVLLGVSGQWQGAQ